LSKGISHGPAERSGFLFALRLPRMWTQIKKTSIPAASAINAVAPSIDAVSQKLSAIMIIERTHDPRKWMSVYVGKCLTPAHETSRRRPTIVHPLMRPSRMPKPGFGPQIGERVTVKSARSSYPLPRGLPERATVTIVAWDRSYTVEYDGQQFTINSVNILQPVRTTNGCVFCPDCQGMPLNLRGAVWRCPQCGFEARR
jgi:hypothetical protein